MLLASSDITGNVLECSGMFFPECSLECAGECSSATTMASFWRHQQLAGVERVNITTTTIDSPIILDTIRTLWLNCACLKYCTRQQRFHCQLIIVKKWQQDRSDYLMITAEFIYNGISFELSRDGVVLDKEEWNR